MRSAVLVRFALMSCLVSASSGAILAGAQPEANYPPELAAPINAASHGPLQVVAAHPDLNFIARDDGPIYLVWRGGTGPYHIMLDLGGRRIDLATTQDHQFAFDLPAAIDRRFAMVIKDSNLNRARINFRVRDHVPLPPADPAVRDKPDDVQAALWLANRLDGMWRIEAISRLRVAAGPEAVRKFISAIGY